MRFSRAYRNKGEPRHASAQSRAAIKRKHKKELATYPLFAEEIAEGQRPADEILAEREESSARNYAAYRAKQAAEWRALRARLCAYEPEKRESILRHWNESKLPGSPMFLADVLQQFEAGKIRPDLKRRELLLIRVLGGWAAIRGINVRRPA